MEMDTKMIEDQFEHLREIRNNLTRFMMMYRFALDELETKVEILKEEFRLLHDYNPIEHTKSRVKTPKSIIEKLHRKNLEVNFYNIKNKIKDIAGFRITCSFISDIYKIAEMLMNQSDLRVIEIKDYIKNPKPNGYRSLHLIIEVPVFVSDRCEYVCVEVQIRTIAMDFWASLEHKIFYKYNKTVPEHIVKELKEAADTAAALDYKMEALHNEIKAIKGDQSEDGIDEMVRMLTNSKAVTPAAFLELFDFAEGLNNK